ncbi:MAG TPA: sulfate ABC transporter substrate-binding protein [Spirochaetia bacterium]|jgi:sulfate transport system substrate-binding protein|nr:sulfate ABC transporter substrate-binding protein [Spirochaetia bacterium]
MPLRVALAGLLALAALVPTAFAQTSKADFTLLNVSYDPTRELYSQYNQLFADYYKKKTGKTVEVKQSHGGSGKQARSVIEGLDADVVTLALAYDIDAVSDSGLLPGTWASRLPQNSTPYTSTIVFLVKKGNPKNLKTWEDLVKPGVGVITSNPKTSGGARWAFLAGYGAIWRKTKSEVQAKAYIQALYKNVPVLDSGARGATLSFAQKGLGDVLLAWENEADLVLNEFGRDKFDVVVPPTSILAEPPVAVVDKVADKKGTRAVAEEYLKYLYSPEAQDLIAKNGYRPRDAAAAKKYASKFAKVDLFTLAETFGDWRSTQKKFFDDGGIFDQIYAQ